MGTTRFKGPRLFCIVVGLLVLSAGPTLAHESVTASLAPATKGEMPSYLHPQKVKGDAVTPATRKAALAAEKLHATRPSGDLAVQSYEQYPHKHSVTGTSGFYDGFIDGKILIRGTNCSYTNTSSVGYSEGHSYGHRASLSGSFEVAQIKAAVGYDYNWSTHETITGTLTLQPRSAGYLQMRDWYKHTDVNYKTEFYDWSGKWLYTHHYSGWTEKWNSKDIVFRDASLNC